MFSHYCSTAGQFHDPVLSILLIILVKAEITIIWLISMAYCSSHLQLPAGPLVCYRYRSWSTNFIFLFFLTLSSCTLFITQNKQSAFKVGSWWCGRSEVYTGFYVIPSADLRAVLSLRSFGTWGMSCWASMTLSGRLISWLLSCFYWLSQTQTHWEFHKFHMCFECSMHTYFVTFNAV